MEVCHIIMEKTHAQQAHEACAHTRDGCETYSYRYGDYTVETAFADTEVSLEERMLAYIRLKCE